MKIKSHAMPGVYYERKDGEIIIHEEDSERMISAPMDIAMRVLYFKKPIMKEIQRVIDEKEKVCEVCGDTFISQNDKVVTCCSKCQNKRKPKKRKSNLTETAVRAKKRGLSYGQYKAQETIQMYGRVKI